MERRSFFQSAETLDAEAKSWSRPRVNLLGTTFSILILVKVAGHLLRPIVMLIVVILSLDSGTYPVRILCKSWSQLKK